MGGAGRRGRAPLADPASRPPTRRDERSSYPIDGGAHPYLDGLFPGALAPGVRWDLDKTRRLLRSVGSPDTAVRWIHVGGTNGKGSVATLCGAVLAAAGRRVGVYTSPHLCRFPERIKVGGSSASDTLLATCADQLRPAVMVERPSFFEAATALAFLAFERAGVEVAVVEVGLGGRLDATNVIHPMVAAITNVSMDHAEYLGDTLIDIAGEKAGIIKPGVPTVCGVTEPPLAELFRNTADRLEAPIRFVRPDEVRDVHTGPGWTTFAIGSELWGDMTVRVPLTGTFQAANAAVALRILEALPDDVRPTAEAVREGLAGVRWPGRLQVVERGGVTWVFDVAHNQAGAHALAAELPGLDLPRPLVVLSGVLGDKDWASMLPPVLAGAQHAVLTNPPSAPSARRWDPFRAAAAVEDLVEPGRLEVLPDFGAALDRVRAVAGGGTVLVTGSCHTVGDAMSRLDPALCAG